MSGDRNPPRTLLEALIRERRQTFEEFAEDLDRLAQESGESGTLSARHAQRLALGIRADGRPLGPVRPATRRLLETALGVRVEDLLAPPRDAAPADDLRQLTASFAAARAAGPETVNAFQQRLDLARQIDRRLGGTSLAAELAQQIRQIRQMQEIVRYSIDGRLRRSLAAVIADACALVGWQWLDQSSREKSWNYYAEVSPQQRRPTPRRCGLMWLFMIEGVVGV